METKKPASRPVVISSTRIWDKAEHSAFTDLIRFRRLWYCTFRESDGHAEGQGKVRIIASRDGNKWKNATVMAEAGIDLRDPKLSKTPDGRLMLLMGGTAAMGTGKRARPRGAAGPGARPASSPPTRQPRVSFSNDGERWTRPRPVLSGGDWLWRVTWRRGRAYGITYRLESADTWIVTLVESRDGLDYREITKLEVPGKPNESTIRFLPGGEAIALVRREGGDRQGWIGRSISPYTDWSWCPARSRFGGPNFIILPDGTMWAAGRSYARGERTVIALLGRDSYLSVLDLPSGGDCSYPGLVWHRGILWVSYYSSHEGKASIYLARVRLG